MSFQVERLYVPRPQPPEPPPYNPGDGTLPAPPTRDQVIHGVCRFQGVRVETQQYGAYNSYSQELCALDVYEDRQAHYKAHRQAGANVCIIGQAGPTYVSGGFTFPVPGPDMRWVDDVNGFADRIAETICVGGFMATMVMMMGDGKQGPDWPYGYEFVMRELPRLVKALQEHPKGDLTKYTIFCPGYDGVIWVWEIEQVYNFGKLFRQLLPNGYLATPIMGAGILGPEGEGKSPQWDTPGEKMQLYDIPLQQFPIKLEDNPPQLTQIGARELGPSYHRPSWQLPEEDPSAPFSAGSANYYLSNGTPRGPNPPWGIEYGTYLWSRNQDPNARIAWTSPPYGPGGRSGTYLEWVEDYRREVAGVGYPTVG